jgi:hypothetical protein
MLLRYKLTWWRTNDPGSAAMLRRGSSPRRLAQGIVNGASTEVGGIKEDVVRREDGDDPSSPHDGRQIIEGSRRRGHLHVSQGCENLVHPTMNRRVESSWMPSHCTLGI